MLKNSLQEEAVNGPGTVVGVNVALSGTLKDQNDIVVHGMVDGQVISDKSVSVGQSAQVKGPVKASIVTVAGTVRGEISAAERLEIMETGKVFGSITTKDLIVRSGAIISGKVEMATEVNEVKTTEVEEEKSVEKSEESSTQEDKVELTPDED